MKLIIAGSRDLYVDNNELSEIIVNSGYTNISEIVSGGASGIDCCGEVWAESKDIYVRKFPADWSKHGKAAGPRRNGQMAEYADALLLIWDGKSTGSANMRARMKGMGKPVFEVIRSTNL